jgi:hypothetical protein
MTLLTVRLINRIRPNLVPNQIDLIIEWRIYDFVYINFESRLSCLPDWQDDI